MATEKAGRVKSALGGKKRSGKSHKKSDSKKKHRVRSMHIRRSDNDKFLVDHEYDNAPGEDVIPNATHALNPEELQPHIQEYMGLPGSEPSPSPEPPESAGLPPARPNPLGGLPPRGAV